MVELLVWVWGRSFVAISVCGWHVGGPGLGGTGFDGKVMIGSSKNYKVGWSDVAFSWNYVTRDYQHTLHHCTQPKFMEGKLYHLHWSRSLKVD